MTYCECQRKDYYSADYKNHIISECTDEWICFALESGFDETQKQDAFKDCLEEITAEGKDDIVVIGSGNTMPLKSGVDLLRIWERDVYAILFRKSLLVRSGRFHELLDEGNILEFIARAADHGSASWISNTDFFKSIGVKTLKITQEYERSLMKTVAYLCCRYQKEVNMHTGFEEALASLVSKLQQKELLDEFLHWLKRFTGDLSLYEKYVRNTAPIFIITGDDTAYGVMKDFAISLSEVFVKQGQAVITTDGRYVPYQGVEDVDGKDLKALIGFQAPALFNPYFQSYAAPKFQFWFDDPVFFDDVFQQIEGDDSYYLLCQDGYHAEHFRKHYHLKNAIQFPPGGIDEGEPDYENRDLDIVFIGTYSDPEVYRKNNASQSKEERDFSGAYVKYMLEHSELTYEQGVQGLLNQRGITLSEPDYEKLIWSLGSEYRYIRSIFRQRVIESIAESGIQLHVYGECWNSYQGKGKENLILHPAIKPNETKEILRRTKISLNIMSWHKDGMTERVIESMLAGAVCVTDETKYIREQGCPAGLFQLNALGELPVLLMKILAETSYRIELAKKAYTYAKETHCWDERAEEILRIVSEA